MIYPESSQTPERQIMLTADVILALAMVVTTPAAGLESTMDQRFEELGKRFIDESPALSPDVEAAIRARFNIL